ncbi:hypothetical protein N9D07_02405 [Alphaproteobacteria bacterium]|nr:hypothetical protein [Alphaproteobacteria bacterium]
MFREFTTLKTVSSLALILNLFSLFGLEEYPEQINNAQEMLASLAVIDMGSWSLPMLTFFENAMYGLMFIYLAAYVLIFFSIRIGRWLLLLSLLSFAPVSLVMGGFVSTVAEANLEIIGSMLDGCLIYLLFFSNKTSR